MQKYEFPETEQRTMEASCVPFAVYQFIDQHVQTIALSQGFLDLFGFDDMGEAVRLMDTDMYRDTHPDDRARIADAAMGFAIDEVPYDVIYRSKSPKKSNYTIVHARGRHVVVDDGTRLAFVWYFDEGKYVPSGNASTPCESLATIMSNALREESVIREAYYDPLTGLPNMSYFFELASTGRREIEQGGRHATVMFVDLAGMQSFNQQYGFFEGNNLIKAVARILAEEFGNERCCYLGQAHFIAIASDEGIDERISDMIARCEMANDGNSLPIRVGVYINEFEPVDTVVAFDRAKLACDRERNSYRSSVIYFDEDMLSKSINAAYVMKNFDRALDEGWVHVFYQPIVRSDDGTICDREALARWFDPKLGMLPPSAFVPVLEEKKLIHRLDLFMVDRIIGDLRGELDSGKDAVPVSVNLSRVDFDVCDIVDEVSSRMSAAKLPPRLLNIEITESAAGQDGDYMQSQIQRLHDLGFHIWMDDFGSGYSSLDSLDSLYLDLVKFDMHFTSQIAKFQKSRLILADMIRMIDDLGISTLAEGVESQEQSDFLHFHGCDKQQGFFHSRPKPIGELSEASGTEEGGSLLL